MFRRTIFGLLSSLIIINSYYPVTKGHWIYLRSAVQPNTTDTINNETDFSQELFENNVTSTTENDILFWTKPDTNEATETGAETEVQMDSDELNADSENVNHTISVLQDNIGVQINETTSISSGPTEPTQDDTKPEENQTNGNTNNYILDSLMDEKIELERNNCHLEIAVQETHDLKIQIKFGKLQNNTSGKCYITLNGHENSVLGVLISNIYLYHQNGSQGEVLKVITADYGSDFIIKEYYSWTKYQPLLLTETHKVYVVLFYKVGAVDPDQQNSHFDLEVFSYHKYENYINHDSPFTESHFPYQYNAQNLPIKETPLPLYYYF